MAIELQVVSLIIEVLLQSVAGMVAILGLVVRYFYHEDGRRIWLTFYFSDIGFDLLNQLQVPLLLKIVLVQNDYPESFWELSQSNK